MRVINIILIFLSVFFAQTWDNHPELEWKYFETEHFIFYFHKETERSALEAKKIAEIIYDSVTSLYNFYPDGQTKGTSHFEKEFYSIINEYINKYGVEQTNSYWGTYCYEHFPCNLHVRHVGDWCRKK